MNIQMNLKIAALTMASGLFATSDTNAKSYFECKSVQTVLANGTTPLQLKIYASIGTTPEFVTLITYPLHPSRIPNYTSVYEAPMFYKEEARRYGSETVYTYQLLSNLEKKNFANLYISQKHYHGRGPGPYDNSYEGLFVRKLVDGSVSRTEYTCLKKISNTREIPCKRCP